MKNNRKFVLVFLGSSSTGKTTLVNKIVSEFGVRKLVATTVSSISRKEAKKGKKINDSVSDLTQLRITLLNLTNILDVKTPFVVCERFLVDNLAYAKLSKNISEDVIKMHEILISYFYSENTNLTIIPCYLPIEFGFKKDGIRKADLQYQQSVDTEIKSILRDFKISYYVVKGTIENRFLEVKHILKNYGIFL